MGPPCRLWKPTATSYAVRHRSTGHCSAILNDVKLKCSLWWHPKTCAVSRSVSRLDWLGAWLWRLLQLVVVVLVIRNPVACGLRGRQNQFRKRVPVSFRIPTDPHLATGLAVDLALSSEGHATRAGPGTALSVAEYGPVAGWLENLDRKRASGRIRRFGRDRDCISPTAHRAPSRRYLGSPGCEG